LSGKRRPALGREEDEGLDTCTTSFPLTHYI
jgi:hypothetical protein